MREMDLVDLQGCKEGKEQTAADADGINSHKRHNGAGGAKRSVFRGQSSVSGCAANLDRDRDRKLTWMNRMDRIRGANGAFIGA